MIYYDYIPMVEFGTIYALPVFHLNQVFRCLYRMLTFRILVSMTKERIRICDMKLFADHDHYTLTDLIFIIFLIF